MLSGMRWTPELSDEELIMKEWNRNRIVELLEESGRIAGEYKSKMNPEIKEDRTIVTQADKAIQQFLDAALTKDETDVYIIGEESMENCDLPKALKNTAFIIDPIDGTAVYACGLPMWGISIGYAVNGKLTESAIYLPETEELLVTESGKTYLRKGDRNGFVELKPCRKKYTDTGAIALSQSFTKQGIFKGHELLNAMGSCVFAGVYLANQVFQAGIIRAKLWDIAGFLPALKNLGFCSLSKNGTDLLSLEITNEFYEMGSDAEVPFRLKCHHIVSSSEENCRRVMEKIIRFPEDN